MLVTTRRVFKFRVSSHRVSPASRPELPTHPFIRPTNQQQCAWIMCAGAGEIIQE